MTDGINGFFSEPTEEAYADKIQEALSDESLFRRIATAAHEQLYVNWDTVVENVYCRYQELIEQKKEQNERNSISSRLKQAFLPDVEDTVL